MNSTRNLFFLGLSSAVMTVSLVGCEANPTELVTELAVAAAKPVKPPKVVGAELEFWTYSVRPAAEVFPGYEEGEPDFPGLTNKHAVNLAVYKDFEDRGESPADTDWASYLGCPDEIAPCSAVTLEFTGTKAISVWLLAVPVVGSCGSPDSGPCILDETMINHRDATIRGGWFVPEIPWELLKPAFEEGTDGRTTLTFYWQGQRGMERLWDTGETEKVRGKIRTIYYRKNYWGSFPDLNFPNFTTPATSEKGPDQFFFHPVFRTGDRTFYHPTYSDSRLLAICAAEPGCLAEYQGENGTLGLSVEFVQNSFDAVLSLEPQK